MATARSSAFIATLLTTESCQGESHPTWDVDSIPRKNKKQHHIKSASNYLGVNSKGVFLSQWQLLKMTVKEILHSGWCFIHQDHDHHTFYIAKSTAKETFLRTTAASPRRKHSRGIQGNFILVPLSISNTDNLLHKQALTTQK